MLTENYREFFNFNPLILKILLYYLNPGTEEKILDLGCGRGFYLKAVEKHAKEAVGIDKSWYAVEKAVTDKVKYGDATDLIFRNDEFDKIYAMHLIEHISNSKKLFMEIARVIKPGGTLILVYPWEPIRGVQALGQALIMHKNPLIARKIHLHKLNPKKIKELIKDTSFLYIKSKFVFPFFFYLTILKKKN